MFPGMGQNSRDESPKQISTGSDAVKVYQRNSGLSNLCQSPSAASARQGQRNLQVMLQNESSDIKPGA